MLAGNLLNKAQRGAQHRQGMLEVDNVNAVTLTKEVRRHLRVSVTGLMTKVDASFQ